MTSQLGAPLTFYNPAAIVFDTETMIALMADAQIRRATARGEFQNLPGAGKPLDLSDAHDPDWWFKRLLKREGLALLPASVRLRKDDAALEEELDKLSNASAVRDEVEQFNQRVIRARYQLPEGPPLITMPRDIETTVHAWAARKAARAATAEENRRLAEEDALAHEEERKKERRRRLFRRRPFRRMRD